MHNRLSIFALAGAFALLPLSAGALDFNGTFPEAAQVNALDRMLMNPYSKPLDYAGTGASLVSVLLPAVLIAAPKEQWLGIGIMYAETIGTACGLFVPWAHSLARGSNHISARALPQGVCLAYEF
jgi:hypothetical protein